MGVWKRVRVAGGVILTSPSAARMAVGASLLFALGCESGRADGGAPRGAPLGVVKEALTLQSSEATSIGEHPWFSTRIGVVSGGEDENKAVYDENSGTFTVTSTGYGMTPPRVGYIPDFGQFVHTAWEGDVEIIVRVSSASNDETPGHVQAGVMIREDDTQESVMASVSYSNDESVCRHHPPDPDPEKDPGCLCYVAAADGLLNMFDYTSRALYGTQKAQPAAVGPFETEIEPPVWLRLQRVGQDFTVSRRRDGGPWVVLSGGEFKPTNALVGFYVGKQWNASQTSIATATFDRVYVGKPQLHYKTSWLGASKTKFSTEYVTFGMNGFFVDPDGTSFKYRAEGDAFGDNVDRIESNGQLTPFASHLHGYYNLFHGVHQGGITGDGSRLYIVVQTGVAAAPYAVQARDPMTFEPVVSGTPPTANVVFSSSPALGKVGGLTARDGRLYVSDWENDRVRVVNIADTPPTELSHHIDFTKPGPIAVDSAQRVWIAKTETYADGIDWNLHKNNDAFVDCYREVEEEWEHCPGSPFPSIDGLDGPIALAIDPGPPSGGERLLVALNGSSISDPGEQHGEQNIRIYGSLGTTPMEVGTFGVAGGVFAGPMPGLVEDAATGPRFFSFAGIGLDTGRNLYVASGAPRVRIQKFAPVGATWSSTPAWPTIYGVGKETGAFDPESDGEDYYTLTQHFSLDLSVDPFADNSTWQPGSEWELDSLTWNPFPEDPADRRFLGPASTVASPSLWRSPQGALFMFVDRHTDTPSNISIYKFEGEIAKPYGFIRGFGDGSVNCAHLPTMNCFEIGFDEDEDGVVEVGTETEASTEGHNAFRGQMDGAGRIWLNFFGGTTQGASEVWRLEPDTEHSPLSYTLPTPEKRQLLTGLVPDTHNVHAHYDDASNAMFLRTKYEPLGCTDQGAIFRYDNWINGSPALHDNFPIHPPDPTCDDPEDFDFLFPNPIECGGTDGNFTSFDVAGGMLFLGHRKGSIFVYDADTAKQVDRIDAGPEVSGFEGWTDINGFSAGAIQAIQRQNGEYLITKVDTVPQARSLLYRWKPPPWTPKNLEPTAWYRAEASDLVYDNTTRAIVRWRDHSDNGNEVSQSAAHYRPEFLADGWNGNKPTVRFDGASSIFGKNPWPTSNPLGAEEPYTVLAVVKASEVRNGGIATWWGVGGVVGAWLHAENGNLFLKSRRIGSEGGDHQFTGTTNLETKRHVLAFRYQSGEFKLTVDGSTQPSAPVGTVTALNGGPGVNEFLIGSQDTWGNVQFKGDISEIVVVPRALDEADILKFQAYAEAEWGGFDDQRPLGEDCEEAQDCDSGFCVDGICCMSACTSDMCTEFGCTNTEEQAGACFGVLLQDGTPCDDGNPSTASDQCDEGVCVGGEWSPTSLAPTAWYFASAEYITDEGGGAVSQWSDRSGNDYHVVQTASGYRPTFSSTGWNGSAPTLTFNGTSSFLRRDPWNHVPPVGIDGDLALDPPYTVLVVMRPAAVQRGGVASWWGSHGIVGAWLEVSGSELFLKSRRKGADFGDQEVRGTAPLNSNRHVIAYRYDGDGSFRFTIDDSNATETIWNSENVSVMVGTSMQLLIGLEDAFYGRYFAGDISELVVVPSAISDTEFDHFRDYADGVWGLD